MKPSLQLRLGHQLTMTPQLQQAIRLLQLSAVDLQTEIQTVLESNIMLEQEDPLPSENPIEETASLSSVEDQNNQDDQEVITWENPLRSLPTRHFNESAGNEIETLNGTQISLQDHLIWQMQLTPFSETDIFIAAMIIDAVNEDGFLNCTIEEIITTLSPLVVIDKSEVEAVLHRVQQFDPIGIACRTLSECLRVQLDHYCREHPFYQKARELILQYLELLAKRDYVTLRRRLSLTAEELQEVISLIQSLNPRPGSEIGKSTAEYIVPDVYVYKSKAGWQVALNPELTPHLQINHRYADLIRRADPSVDNQFLRTQLQEARWFLKSIENRNDTLLKVARSVVKRQENFLEFGPEAMVPLTLHDIAQDVDLHDSTISRVTTQKYLYTPRGTFELKYFFSSHVNTDMGGECSATAIRAFIKKLISNENHKKPLSDSIIAKLLEERGIKVARRTVAKYREGMLIPPSSERKELS